jgi:diguanylate cyclase (GGDEF)-like protein/PAS domain S-box-containing protein
MPRQFVLRMARAMRVCMWAAFCAWLGATLMPAGAQAQEARRLDSVRLQLKWLHQFQFAGFYAALEKGYYRDAGLDVSIHEASAHESALDVLARGDAEFALHGSDSMVARARGQPIVALAAIFQHSPMVLLTRKDAGISSLHDLAGKRILLGPDATELLAYLKHERVPAPSGLTVQSFDLKALMGGEVDAMPAYSTDETYLLNKARIDYNAFSPRAAGIDFYGDVLLTTEEQARLHPERVRRFREASMRGWYYALSHKEEMVDLILAKYSQRHSREHLLFEAAETHRLIASDMVELGHMSAGRWRHIADIYAELGMMPAEYDFTGFLYDPEGTQTYQRYMWLFMAAFAVAVFGGAMAWYYRRLSTRLGREMSERKAAEARLRESEARFRTLVDTSPDGVIMTDPAGVIRYVSLRILSMLGYQNQADLVGRHALDLIVAEDRAAMRRYFFRLLRSGRAAAREFRAARRAGGMLWMEANGERMLGENGQVSDIFFISRDISGRKRLEAELERMAHTDVLTNLPNRRRFLELLRAEVTRCERHGHPMAVMELDLDHFKQVNDKYGHSAGDEVLKNFASLIRGRLRHYDFACRFGGEEFMIALPEARPEEASMVAERIRRDLEASHIQVEDNEINVTVSIGVAQWQIGATPDSLIKQADDALYRAKRLGRNRVEY